MTNLVTRLRSTFEQSKRLFPGSEEGLASLFEEAAAEIERLQAENRTLRNCIPDEPTADPAVVEQQLAADVHYFGSGFYRLVDGRKVRIPPNEIYVEIDKPGKGCRVGDTDYG